MATVGLKHFTQTQQKNQNQNRKQRQKQRQRQQRASACDQDKSTYDGLDTQFQPFQSQNHQNHHQREDHRDYHHQDFRPGQLCSIPSSEALSGLIDLDTPRAESEIESEEGWITPESPEQGSFAADLVRRGEEKDADDEVELGGSRWISELDEQLDRVGRDRVYQINRITSRDAFLGRMGDDVVPEHPYGQGSPHRAQTRTHNRPRTRAQSQSQSRHGDLIGNRARSIDRAAFLSPLRAGSNTGGRPFSPSSVGRGRGRPRGRNSISVSASNLNSNSVDPSSNNSGMTVGPTLEVKEQEENKLFSELKVSVKEVLPCLDRAAGGERLVSSPVRRRRESRNRDTHPHLTLYHQLHPSGVTCVTQQPKLDVYTATISSLVQALRSHSLSSVQIVEAYLNQIGKHNEELRALCWVRERESLLREASGCDQMLSRGIVDWERTPLWGVPIVVKDNIATEEELGMPTTAGSFALLGMPVKKDAFVVQKLRRAGAISECSVFDRSGLHEEIAKGAGKLMGTRPAVLAKANMSELADYKSAHAGPGWSAVGGQTINVYAAHASPGTSSSGNGVAVAAGFCPASIGTETGESGGPRTSTSSKSMADSCSASLRRRIDHPPLPSILPLRTQTHRGYAQSFGRGTVRALL